MVISAFPCYPLFFDRSRLLVCVRFVPVVRGLCGDGVTARVLLLLFFTWSWVCRVFFPRFHESPWSWVAFSVVFLQ
jgi:hypothetical protein